MERFAPFRNFGFYSSLLVATAWVPFSGCNVGGLYSSPPPAPTPKDSSLPNLPTPLPTATPTSTSTPVPPVAIVQTLSVPDNSILHITLNGTDPSNLPLTYSIVANPAHGQLTGTAPNLNYQPTAPYQGLDSFQFTVNDGAVDSNIATISINVSHVAPVSYSQSFTVNDNSTYAVTLSATDTGGAPLSYSVVTSPTHGVLSGSAPALVFTPNLPYGGNDFFTFTVNDGLATSNLATVSISIAHVDRAPNAPTAVNCPTTLVGGSIANTCTLTAASPADPDGDSVTYVDGGSTCPSVVINSANGGATFNGPSSGNTCVVSVKAFDGTLYSSVVSSSTITAYNNLNVSGTNSSLVSYYSGTQSVVTSPGTVSLSSVLNSSSKLNANFSTDRYWFGDNAALRAAGNPYTNLFMGFGGGRSYTSTASIGSKMYLYGGEDPNALYHNDVWVFDTSAHTWTLLKADNNAGVGVAGTNYPATRLGQALAAVGTKLYLVGGYDGSFTYFNDVWSFDTVSNSWALVKGMNNGGTGSVNIAYPIARYGHSLQAVGTTLYLFGGSDSSQNSHNDVWTFDTGSSAWALASADNSSASFPLQRSFQSMASIATSLYVLGGSDENAVNHNDVWVFDTLSNVWLSLKTDNNGGSGTEGTNYPTARSGQITSAVGSKLIFIGGLDSNNDHQNDVWSFDTATNSWALLLGYDNGNSGQVNINYPEGRAYFGAMTLANQVVITGGEDDSLLKRIDVWAFDTTANTWTVLKSDSASNIGTVQVNYPMGRQGLSMSTIGSNLYVFGGLDSTNQRHNDVWSFNPNTNAWTLIKAENNGGSGVAGTNFPTERSNQTMAAVGTKLYIVGGQDSSGNKYNDVWSFDTSSNTWALANGGTGAPHARSDHAMVSIGNTLYLCGGVDGNQFSYNLYSDLWSFDTTQNTWTEIAANGNGTTSPATRADLGMVALGTILYIYGGNSGPSGNLFYSDTWTYPLGGGGWTKPSVGTFGQRHGQAMAAIGSKIFSFGGYDQTYHTHGDLYILDTAGNNTWTYSGVINTGPNNVGYPGSRALAGMSTIGSKMYLMSGTGGGPTGLEDVWVIDPSVLTVGNSQTVLVGISVNAPSGSLATQPMLLQLSMLGSGDIGGVNTAGVVLYVWDDATGDFVSLANNTATTLGAGWVSATIDPSYRTNTGMVYLLLKSNSGQGSTFGSTVDLGFSDLSLTAYY
jgi:hypothetical protein